MKRDEVNKLIKSVNATLIEPSGFPEVKVKKSLKGFIWRKDDECWMSQDVFEKTLICLSSTDGHSELIAAEDFERVYKSTGETVRLNKTLEVNWAEFYRFCSNNEMISFYIFDQSLKWCAWFNDEYWILVFDKNINVQLDDIYFNVNSALQAFPDGDIQFNTFIKHLYAVE